MLNFQNIDTVGHFAYNRERCLDVLVGLAEPRPDEYSHTVDIRHQEDLLAALIIAILVLQTASIHRTCSRSGYRRYRSAV